MKTRTPDSSATRFYSGVVIACGGALLILHIPGARIDEPWLFWSLLVGSVVISASKVHLPLTRGTATLSMSHFVDFLSLVLFGADLAMVVAGVSGATQCLIMTRRRPSIRRTSFSAATLIITMQVTGAVADALGGFSRGANLLALAAVTVNTATMFFLMNSSLVAIAVALSRQQSAIQTWYADFLWAAPAYFIGAALAVAFTQVSSPYIWAPILTAGPLFVTYKAYRIYLGRVEEQQRHLKEISALHLASVEALARAIDARDQTIDHARAGENHLHRVQSWATSLAEAAGMSRGEVEAVRIAALLHDIGKLAVPEHILTKPGGLTAKEFARVRIHPIVGAEIIKAVPFPYSVAPLIRSHHERWDGSGYPDGLRGEETPRGARVLAVVDYFDALTSARPYHGPATRDDAITTLRAEAGRALDPSLVTLFLEILPTLEQRETSELPVAATSHRRGLAQPLVAFADDRGSSASSWVFHNISLATQEMRELHGIAQTLGTRLSVDDTMALLTSKLGRLIPGSCWLFYLYDGNDDVLRCRFASGLDAETVARLHIPCGEGPTGWAARHRTAVLNARAATDFEVAGLPSHVSSFQSALSYPLVDDDQLIGTLTVYHVEGDPFREEHRHVLDHISTQAASVLRNAVAFERLRDVSFSDPLTELPNSRALTDFLRRHLGDGSGERRPTALIMIDLDEFKAVNDGHGHQHGDAALRAVATVIRERVRGSDFCARYGGDEFVAVLGGCDRSEAEHRARDLQMAVEGLLFESTRGKRLSLGISVGVSVFPDDGTTISALITAADHRMYLNKSTRRALSESGPLGTSS